MSKYVTISLLGPPPLNGVKLYDQDAVDYMINHWQAQLEQVLDNKPDLIVIPEACDRFPSHSMAERKKYYMFKGNKIRDFFAKLAKSNSCYFAYSAVRKMNTDTYLNSTQLIDRNGNIAGIYNKNHLVPGEKIEGDILYGKDAPVFKTDFGTVVCAICFDLNFHELLEKYAGMRPDLIIFSSMYHGGIMQNYWAYHCRSHFVGAIASNECTIINPVGEKIAYSTNYFNHITKTINLDCKVVHLDENRGKLRAIKNKYGRGVTIFDPGHLGAILLTLEMSDKSVTEIINEFDIETWDEYYQRCSDHRHALGNMEP